MNNITLLTYTNSSCKDVHPIYFDSIKKYFNGVSHCVLTDEKIDNDTTQILYDNNSKYYQQMILALNQINTDYVLYSQEDYILFDYVDLNKVNEYLTILDNNQDIKFIRLIQSGVDGDELEFNDELIYLKKNHFYYFSTQITIWRKSCLIDMFNSSMVDTVTEEPKNSPFLKSIGGIGLCTTLKGDKVGGHYNSIIYPYIATAINKGKWNFSEYGDKLENLLSKYDIDKYKRNII